MLCRFGQISARDFKLQLAPHVSIIFRFLLWGLGVFFVQRLLQIIFSLLVSVPASSIHQCICIGAFCLTRHPPPSPAPSLRYDKTIMETEAAYMKILESSQTLLHVSSACRLLPRAYLTSAAGAEARECQPHEEEADQSVNARRAESDAWLSGCGCPVKMRVV